MNEKTQISTTIDPGVRQMLESMAEADLRTLRHEIEWLITQEYARRQSSLEQDVEVMTALATPEPVT